jgi:predicted alpha/beta superfamily hydrolase
MAIQSSNLTCHIKSLLSTAIMVTVVLSLQAQQVGSFVLGHIDKLHSAVLGEDRILNIYLPDGYVENDSLSYPVIYLLDGSADEDFIHVVGLVQFSTFPWVNRMPPSIVVGIANVDRQRDFSFPTTAAKDKERFPTTGGSANFMRFVAEELQPYIDKMYRTTASRTIIGQSLAGLLATEFLLKRPELFTDYIIISPSLWWDNGSLLEFESPLFSTSALRNMNVYIGVGKEGLTPGQFPRVMEVDANLLYDRLMTKAPGLNVHFDYLPKENHATAAHIALYNAIELIFTPKMK